MPPRRVRIEPGDEPTRASSLTSADVQARIRAALSEGPLFMYALVARLRLTAIRVELEVRAMRKAGTLKTVGNNKHRRQWALCGQPSPFMPWLPKAILIPPKAPPSTSSWWLTTQTSQMDEFYAAAKARNVAMANDPKWRTLRGETS